MLVVLCLVLTFFSAFAIWLRALVLNTDSYVRAVGPVLENQQLRDTLADEIVGQLYQHVDVTELLRESLPSRAADFAPTIAASIRDTSTLLASKALATEAVQKAWREANRLAHEQIVSILRGGGNLVSTKNGEVSIETGALTAQVRKALNDNDIHVFDDVKTSQLNDRFVLFRSTDLQHLQTATSILDNLGLWLPLLAFAQARRRSRARSIGAARSRSSPSASRRRWSSSSFWSLSAAPSISARSATASPIRSRPHRSTPSSLRCASTPASRSSRP